MRLALVSTQSLPVPPIRGGAVQTHIAGVLPHLARHHAVTVFSPGHADLPPRETAGGIDYVRLPRQGYLYRVRRQVSRSRFDVIHVFNRPAWLPVLRAAAPKSRFILGLHNEVLAPSKISRRRGRAALATARAVVTVSRYIARTAIRRFPGIAGRVEPVYTGVDLERFRPAWDDEAQAVRRELRDRYGVAGRKVILCVGRLNPRKGQHLLFEALPAILRRHPEAVLLLVGSRWFGDNRPSAYVRSIRRRARHWGDRAILTGWVPQEEVHRFFWAADVFVCPSQWQEPLARVHYEAMAAGCPIVTTARGGNPEVIADGRNGLLVRRYRSPIALARRICDVLDDPARARSMAEEARRLVAERFTWEQAATRLLRVYDRVVSGGRNAR